MLEVVMEGGTKNKWQGGLAEGGRIGRRWTLTIGGRWEDGPKTDLTEVGTPSILHATLPCPSDLSTSRTVDSS